MKKVYTAIALMLLTASVFAQIPYRHVFGNTMTRDEVQAAKAARLPALQGSTRDIYQFYVDYSTSAFDDLFYVWYFNTNYNANDFFPINYSAVVMNYMVGYTDPADPVNSYIDWSMMGLSDSFPATCSITVDSMYDLLTHMNLTGHLDTFVMKIVKCGSNGAPSTAGSNILYSHRDSVDYGLSPDNDWLGTIAILATGPGYTITPGQKTAGVIEYYNRDKTDTCGILSGCINDGGGGAASFSVYQNSYMRLPPNIPSITKNANIGYDTDGDGVVDKAFEAQDWNILFLVTLNTELGIADNFDNLKVTGVSPNPASGTTNVLYGLNKAADVKITLLDLSGRTIKQVYSGTDAAGSFVRNIDVSDVNTGTYLVSVQAGNGTPVVSKLVVNR